MLMMRSSSVTKMGKPPPPVPPRPSKTIVAEALAKRKNSPELFKTTPCRAAPVPPVPISVISTEHSDNVSKSQSNGNINFILKKPSVFERSISEEIKVHSRPVVFQSSNMKPKLGTFGVKRTAEKELKVSCVGTKSDLILNNQIDRNNINLPKEIDNESNIKTAKENCSVNNSTENVQTNTKTNKQLTSTLDIIEEPKCITQLEICLVNQDLSNIDSDLAKLQNKTSGKVTTETNVTIDDNSSKIILSEISSASLVDDFDDDTASKGICLDLKPDDLLNDRNHVNTLIDEMFASVLEVSGEVDCENEVIVASNPSDITKITVNQTDDIGNVSPESSSVDIMCSTVLILDNNESKSTTPPDSKSTSSTSSTMEKKKVQFDDKRNHEFLISELQSMKKEQQKIMKRQRKPSQNFYESDSSGGGDTSNIRHSDWVEMCNGREEKLSSCQINIVDLNNTENVTLDYERLSTMSSLHGLPPLPKSLSGFSLLENHPKPPTPVRTTSIRGQPPSVGSGHLVYPPHSKMVNGSQPDVSAPIQGRKSTNLDTQLAILKREMYSLRQLDLSLLSQLWSLNESIQDFRQILQDNEDRVLSPPSPSPVASSGDEGEGDEFYMSTPSLNFRPAPPPPPARRPSNSSNASTGG